MTKVRITTFGRASIATALAALVAGTALIASAVLVQASAGGSWAQYHGGPDRTGFNSAETSLGKANLSELAVSWSRALSPGTPITSPVVSDGKVFVGSNDSRVYAVDEATGAISWSGLTGASIIHSPAVADGRVYVGSDDTKVYAYPVSCSTPCSPLWVKQLAGRVSGSPAVADGVVYVGAGRGADGDLWALDAVTGAEIWRAALSNAPTTPAVAGGMVYVGASALFAFPTTCSNPCGFAWVGQGVNGEPVVSGNHVFIDAGFVNRFFVFPTSCTTPCPPTWDTFTLSGARIAPAVGAAGVYLAEFSGAVQAFPVDCTSGCAPLWTTTLPSRGQSPALANGVLYIAGTDGTLYALDPATGAILLERTLGAGLLAAAVVNGTVYVGSASGTLYALRAPVVDDTAPDIEYSVSPAPNALGWNNTTVTVTWTVADPESGIASSTGCDPQVLSTETAGTTLTCSAQNGAGLTAARSVSVALDMTAPVIAFSGNAGTYTADQSIAITCSSSDALSGIATSSCPSFSGPAYAAGPGIHTLTASATDNAGNSTTSTTSFTVVVTYDSLCTLTRSFVTSGDVADSLCEQLAAAKDAASRGNIMAAEGALRAFDSLLQAQTGKSVTSSNADLLRNLATYL